MANLEDTFSDNDKNMYNYLNQKIIQYIENTMLSSIPYTKYNTNDIREGLRKSNKPFSSLVVDFFGTNNNQSINISYNFVENNKVSPGIGNAVKFTDMIPILDRNYRLSLIYDNKRITNLGYPTNYMKNIDAINKVRDTNCSGLCSCNFTNVSLSTNLLFTTGVNVNLTDTDTEKIYENIKLSQTNVDKSGSSSESTNWLPALLGVPGIIYAVENPTISKDAEINMKKVISNISLLYANTINQLITSSQELVVKGTGIKVHNISLESIQDITMTASQKNCGSGDCLLNNLNDLTNNLMSDLQKDITNKIKSSFAGAFDKNKNLIIGGGIFVFLTMLLWFFLLFKRASSKK